MDRVVVPEPNVEERDNVVVMRGVTWSVYQTLLEARGERPRPRLAYLDGAVEIMTTSARHELTKTKLARLVEAWVGIHRKSFNGLGSTTLNREADEAGVESDECYFIGRLKEFPDLAFEVVETHGGIDKLEIYRRLGVREVWFWINDKIWVYELAGGAYRARSGSRLLPRLDLAELARIVRTMDDSRQTETVERYRRVLEGRRRSGRRRATRTVGVRLHRPATRKRSPSKR